MISSEFQTKDWRKDQEWYKGGRSNECEKMQMKQIFEITGLKPEKTNFRLFLDDNVKMQNKKTPMTEKDGFEWSENFDGYLKETDEKEGEKNLYFNLKFVCESGGAQTRTLREVYHFIKHQIKFLENKEENKDDKDDKDDKKIYFLNILDGHFCFVHKDKFDFLFEGKERLKKYIFVGDMCQFRDFWERGV